MGHQCVCVLDSENSFDASMKAVPGRFSVCHPYQCATSVVPIQALCACVGGGCVQLSVMRLVEHGVCGRSKYLRFTTGASHYHVDVTEVDEPNMHVERRSDSVRQFVESCE